MPPCAACQPGGMSLLGQLSQLPGSYQGPDFAATDRSGAAPYGLLGLGEASLAARVLVQEHMLYPRALRLLAEGRSGWSDPGASLSNPLPGLALPP